MMRLCFGTFARVLQLCKLDGVTNPQLVGTMTRTIDPNCQYINGDNATPVSRLLHCKGNLSPGNIKDSGSGAEKKPGESISNVLQMAPKADRKDLIRKFSEDVVYLLDEDKKLQVVLALLDIIEKDSVLDDESANGKKMSFEKYVGTTKNALLSQSEYVLSDLLAGIFLYTVAAGVKNTDGRSTVVGLTHEYINGLKNTKGIKIVNHLKKVDHPENVAIENILSPENEPTPLDEAVTLSNTITIHIDEEGKFKDENNQTRSSIIFWYANTNKKANVVFDDARISLLKRRIEECEQKMAGGCFDDETEKWYLANVDALRVLSNNYRQNATILLFDDKKFYEYVNFQTSGSWVGTGTQGGGAAAYYSIIRKIIDWDYKVFHQMINDKEFREKNIEIDCSCKVFDFQTMINLEYLKKVTEAYCDESNLGLLGMFGYYVSDFNFKVIVNIAVDYYLSIARLQSNQPEKFEKIREKLFDTSLMDYQIGIH